MKIQCQQCTSQFKVPEKYYGKRIKCPKCKGPISVPIEQLSSAQNPSAKAAEASSPRTENSEAASSKAAPAPNQKIKIACQSCEATLNVPPNLIGKRVACPKCKQPVHLVLPDDINPPPKSPVAAAEPTVAHQPTDAPKPPVQDTSSIATSSTDQLPLDSDSESQLQQATEPPAHPNDDGLADESEPKPTPRSDREYRKRRKSSRSRRSKSKGLNSKIMPIVSGLIVATGMLLALAALYMHFFGVAENPDSESGQSKLVASGSNGTPVPREIIVPARTGPVEVAEIKPREALVPSLKMFEGQEQPTVPSFTSWGYNITAKSEYLNKSEFTSLPEPMHFRGKIHLNSKPSTIIPIDNGDERQSYYPPETYASGLRLPEGLFLIPIDVIQFADFITIFDGDGQYEVGHTRVLKRGKFRILLTTKRPDFPRVVASNTGELNGETKGATLIWVDRNSEIHVMKDLDATGYDPISSDVTFAVPEESVGGLITNQDGQILGLVSDVRNGIGNVTQIKKILADMRRSGDELFDFDRLPVSDDAAGKLLEASACVVQVVCKRNQRATHTAFQSDIETQRGEDSSTKQTYNDRYDVNFNDNGRIEHFSMFEGGGCRLPGFLGFPGLASIIEFPEPRGQSNWKVEKKLSLGPAGNDQILVSGSRDRNELKQVIQTDEYRIVKETEDHLTIERKYLAKSFLNEPNQESLEWEVPAGFPFHVEGKFVYRYDKKMKLTTSIKFEGVEQKQFTKDVIAPLKISFEMESIPDEEIDTDKLPWKAK